MFGEEDIIHIFKPLIGLLKKPKTTSSERNIWLPKTVAYALREWKKPQEEIKGFLGDEYNLSAALPNSRPCENRVLKKSL